METETGTSLDEFLRAFQTRKGMYVQPVTVETVRSFLTGFIVASAAFGYRIEYGGTRESLEKRGLEWGPAIDPVSQMQALGWSDERIMDEAVEIEIETIEAMRV